jgi:hypothetical protein
LDRRPTSPSATQRRSRAMRDLLLPEFPPSPQIEKNSA